jgi:hypothetical protein
MKLRRSVYFFVVLLSINLAWAQCPTTSGFGGTTLSSTQTEPEAGETCTLTGNFTQGSYFNDPTLTVEGELIIDGNLSMLDEITLLPGATLTITGTLTINSDAILNISAGATVNAVNIENGGWLSSDGGRETSGTVAGTINVTGNFNNNDGGNITVNDGGEINVVGTFTNDAGSTLIVDDGGAVDAGTFTDDGGTESISGSDTDCLNDGCCGACSGGDSVVPVELIDFMATLDINDYCILEWSTATEVNNEGFVIERAVIGSGGDQEFVALGFVEGEGTSTRINEYRFTDPSINESSYYRLKQMDFDGNYEYSPIVFVEFQNQFNPKLFPNPYSESINIQGISNSFSYVIYDLKGHLMDRQTDVSKRDLSASLTSLTKGTYLLSITSGLNNFKTKIVKE